MIGELGTPGRRLPARAAPLPRSARPRRPLTGVLAALAVALLMVLVANLADAAGHQRVDLGIDVQPKSINNTGIVVGTRPVAGAATAFR